MTVTMSMNVEGLLDTTARRWKQANREVFDSDSVRNRKAAESRRGAFQLTLQDLDIIIRSERAGHGVQLRSVSEILADMEAVQ